MQEGALEAPQIQQEQRLVQQLKTRRGKLDKALAEPDARTERERLRKEVAKANAKRQAGRPHVSSVNS